MFLSRMLNIARANGPVDHSREEKQHAHRVAHDIASHYVQTACINSDPIIMGATVYCAAYDALLAGGGAWATRMNCGPIATACELSNAVSQPAVKRKGGK